MKVSFVTKEHKKFKLPFSLKAALVIFFFSLGVFVLVFGNYFLAALLFLTPLFFFILETKEPKKINITITQDQIVFGPHIIPTQDIVAYSFKENPNGDLVLVLSSKSLAFPYLELIVPYYERDNIDSILKSANVKKEKEIPEPFYHAVARYIEEGMEK